MRNSLILSLVLALGVSLLSTLLAPTPASAESGASKSEAPNEDASKAQPSENKVEFTKLSAGVWMHTSYKNVKPWGLILTNGLIFEREDHSVLVDTAWNDDQTAQIISWANEELGKPIKASLHTHAHSDKMGGMATLHAKGVESYASNMSNEFAPKRGLLPAKNNLNLDTIAKQTNWHGLRVMYPGGGHTQDNIVVYDKLSEVIFGGCLIRPGNSRSLGFTGDADLEYWSQAAKNVATAFPDAKVVVPSHGEPGGPEVLTNTIEIASPAQ